MSNFLFITNPSDGHVNPILPIAKTMVERGHAVKWINGSAFKEKVEKTGAIFIGCGSFRFTAMLRLIHKIATSAHVATPCFQGDMERRAA